jgi:ATP-binding cassette subfamily B protein
MLRLIKFLKGYRAAAIAGPFFKLAEAVFELIIPLAVASLVDSGIAAGDKFRVINMGLAMLALGAAGLAFSLSCQYLAAKASLGFGTNLRKTLYSRINKFGYDELDRFGAPSLVTRLTNDINQAQTGVAMFIRLVLRAPLIAAGSIIMAVIISPKLSLIFIAMAAAVSVSLYIIMSRTSPVYGKIQKQLDRVALLSRENLSGARVVRAFSREDDERADFSDAAQTLSKTSRAAGAIAGLLNPLTYALANFAVICVLWFGGFSVNSGTLTQGKIVALINYLIQVQLSLVVVANFIVIFTKASACAKRINEALDVTPAIRDPQNPAPPPSTDGDAPAIEFKDVGFAYALNASESLGGINFVLNAGESLGVIGSTGSGKTTLVNLIGRFYDVTSGAVSVFGTNVKDYALKDLRSAIGYVPQANTLFYGTVRDNILWGKPDATDAQILSALQTAQAADFVNALADGLDAVIEQGGKNLSGGQKQRLCIARALIREPKILILDDSSAALDYATDAALRRALAADGRTVTAVTVSQRANSIRACSRILVLDEGRAVGLGAHSGLLRDCAVYREICSSQESEAAAK